MNTFPTSNSSHSPPNFCALHKNTTQLCSISVIYMCIGIGSSAGVWANC